MVGWPLGCSYLPAQLGVIVPIKVERDLIMTKQMVLVLTEPTEGKEDEFNEYYEHLHLTEVLSSTELKSAQRYQLVDQVGEDCPLPYLALYEGDSSDTASFIANLNETRSQRQQSDSLNKRTARIWVFEAIGPEHHESGHG